MKIKTICKECGRRARLINAVCLSCAGKIKAFDKEKGRQEAVQMHRLTMRGFNVSSILGAIR